MRTRSYTFHAIRLFTIIVLLGILVAGCGTTRTTALQNARTAYAQAQANPVVTANAPVTLYGAGQSLQRAEQAGNEAEQRHYAYLAQRQTQQAVSEAEQKTAENQISQLGQQREQIVLQSREQQAAQARAQAQAQAQQAEQARGQAQAAEQQAMMAREQEARAREQAGMAQQQAMVAREQAQVAREQARQLEDQLSELKARQTERGVQLTMSDVMFSPGQANLAPGAMLSLNKLADILKQNPNEKAVIEGHTDNTGSPGFNKELSERRASAVRDALVSRGVSPDRITARGLGESFPVASNATQAGRQQNRRVEIVIVG